MRDLGGTSLRRHSPGCLAHCSRQSIDTTRMRTEFGFVPQHTTSETFDSFVEAHNLNRLLPPERVENLEDQLLALLTGKDDGRA